jgi:hypothetical protein
VVILAVIANASLRTGSAGKVANESSDLEGKQKRAKTEGVNSWVDPEGYRRFIASKRRAFEDEVDSEMGKNKTPHE